MLRRKRLIAAKTETTIGTAISLAAADAAFNAFDFDLTPTIEMTERPSQASMSHLPAVVEAYGAQMTFKTHLFGNGAAGTPGWASTLLPACGWVESLGTFSPSTEAPGANVKTLTMAVYEDGFKRQLRGASGTFKIVLVRGQIITLEWTFTGIWDAPTDVAILAPTYPTIKPLRFASSTFTIGGAAPQNMNEIMFDAGNNVILIPDPTDVSGYSHAMVTDRKVIGTMNPEQVLVATKDPHGLWLAGTEEALSLAVTDGTDTITIAAPKLQRTNIQPGDRDGQSITDIEFQCNKSADAGDDEFTIDFS